MKYVPNPRVMFFPPVKVLFLQFYSTSPQHTVLYSNFYGVERFYGNFIIQKWKVNTTTYNTTIEVDSTEVPNILFHTPLDMSFSCGSWGSTKLKVWFLKFGTNQILKNDVWWNLDIVHDIDKNTIYTKLRITQKFKELFRTVKSLNHWVSIDKYYESNRDFSFSYCELSG